MFFMIEPVDQEQVQLQKSLSTNSDRAEISGNDTNHGFVSAFGNDGFTVDKGTLRRRSYTNHNGWNYLAYS